MNCLILKLHWLQGEKRNLVLKEGEVTAAKLLEIQEHYTQWQLHLEVKPESRCGFPKVQCLLHCLTDFLACV